MYVQFKFEAVQNIQVRTSKMLEETVALNLSLKIVLLKDIVATSAERRCFF